MTISAPEDPRATHLSFEDEMLVVRLEDAREVRVPPEWYPRLRAANDTARVNWRLVGGGIGIHWESIDEDLSVRGLLAPPTMTGRSA